MLSITRQIKVLAWLVLLGALVDLFISAVLLVLVTQVPRFSFDLVMVAVVVVSTFLACTMALALCVLEQEPPTAH